MPSKALQFFEKKLLTDVDRLIETHESLSGGRQGRHHLGHITRSGFVMLCAAWESYTELVAEEALAKMLKFSDGPKCLPKPIQKKIANTLRERKNPMLVLDLAGDGWKKLAMDIAKLQIGLLHTPKPNQLEDLFKNVVGIDSVWDSWNSSLINEIKDFVTQRGDIAHKGSDAQYVKINHLKKHREIIPGIAVALDNQIADHIRDHFPKPHAAPWRRRKVI